MATEYNYRLIASLEIVTAAGLILWWVAFFTAGMAPESPPASYFAFENALVLPDLLLSLLLLTAGSLLMKNRPVSLKLSLLAGGALIFVGMLEICFNIQNGIYTASPVDLVINALFNLWCVGFGVAIAISIMRKKDA